MHKPSQFIISSLSLFCFLPFVVWYKAISSSSYVSFSLSYSRFFSLPLCLLNVWHKVTHVAYYVRSSRFLCVREWGKRSGLRVTWSLLAVLRWSQAMNENLSLYAFSLFWWVVVCGTIDNVNFLLIWIPIINFTLSISSTFSARSSLIII